MTNEKGQTGPVGSTGGSAMDATQAAETKLREQVWRHENHAERFCDNVPEVKLILDELTRLRRQIEQWRQRAQSLEYERDAAYDNDDIPLGAKLDVQEVRAIYARTDSPNVLPSSFIQHNNPDQTRSS